LHQVRFKDPIIELHESGWSIGEFKRHHHVPIMPVMRSECNLEYVFVLNVKLMVSRSNIYIGENPSFS